MKDFTQIQLEPIPPSVSSLQKANGSLKDQNELLKNILVISSVVVVGLCVYHFIKRQKEEDDKKASEEDGIMIITK